MIAALAHHSKPLRTEKYIFLNSRVLFATNYLFSALRLFIYHEVTSGPQRTCVFFFFFFSHHLSFRSGRT